MGSVQAAMYTTADLEVNAEYVKAAIFDALAAEGVMTIADADTWCANHTIIFRKKNLFLTISHWWRKTKSQQTDSIVIVVKKVHTSVREKTDAT